MQRTLPAIALACALLALLPAAAAAAVSSVADDPTWTVGQTPVEAFAPDGDRAWVGGNFTTTAARSGPGVELDLSGNRVAGFPELTDSTASLQVDAVTGDGGGGWYVAGTFTRVGGVVRPGLVHVAPGGAVDTAFDAQASAGSVLALTLSGGVLYAGGTFTSIGGATRTSLAALDPATGAATGWDPPTSAGGVVRSISVQGGFAWVGGGFTSVGATAVTDAAKVPVGNSAVSADATWTPDPNLQVRAIVATATNVYMGGLFNTVKATTTAATNHLTKTNLTDGTPDAGWTPNPNGTVQALDSDGTDLYAAGLFTDLNGTIRRGVAAVRLDNTGGGAATAWYPGDLNQGGAPAAIAVGGGVVYVGGAFSKAGGGPRSALAAAPADATGALSGWAPEADGPVNAIAADGKHVYAGGRFGGVGALQQQSLMAIDLTTGQPMPYFSHTFDGDIRAIAVCNGVVYVGGTFFTVDGQNRLNAAAFDRNTGALEAWDPQSDNDVDAIACGSGVIYLGGIFQTLDFNNVGPRLQQSRGGLAAVDPVVGEPTAWDPGVAGNQVNSILVRGSTVYAGGTYTTIGNPAVARVDLAAIDAAGAGAATSWDPNVPGGISALAFSAGNTVYAAGSLTGVGGSARTRAAEIDLGTGAPTAFDPAPDNLVRSIAVAPDGTIYMAGNFANVGGQARPAIAAVDPSGAATAWKPQAAGVAGAVAVGDDGRVFAGGSFDGTTLRAGYGLATFSEPTSFATQPALAAAPVEGQAVTCNGGTPGGSLPAPQTVQWMLDGAPIAGAGGSSYTPVTADVGHALSCHVSQRNLISTAQADSAAMTVAAAPVQSQPPPPVPFDIDGFATPPPPVVAKSVVATPVKGTVTVLLPTLEEFIPLPDAERVPVGTVVDARHGTVQLTTVGKGGKLQTATFYDGEFQVFQEKGKNPVVELRLYGGDFSVCPKAKRVRGALAAGRIPRSRSIRHLWGNGKGLFRTRGRYASATIRGTKWLTDDRCDGTLVRVAQGAVTVRDFPRKRSVLLKAPKSYLALARR